MKRQTNSFGIFHLDMHYILKVFVLLFPFMGMACQGDETGSDIEPESGWSWTQEATQLLNDGIKAGFEKTVFTLDFHTARQVPILVSSNAAWLNPVLTVSDDGQGDLRIEVTQNGDMAPREGEVVLTVNGEAMRIRVAQDGFPKVVFDKESYEQLAEGGTAEIRVKAHGELSAKIYPSRCKWARITKIIACGENEYAITLDVDKNEGLGRILSFSFWIDGKHAFSDCGPCLIQRPAPFAENMTIATEQPGSLQVLMGHDVTELRRIRSLKLVGPINRYDFVLLRQLFLTSEESIDQYPIEVDLSDCSIGAGYRNPFDYYGWKPSGTDDAVYLDAEIPFGLFSNAKNLKGIILPNDLEMIGRSAFYGCKNLRSISIPNSVEEINSKAFYECTGLEDIHIDERSSLSTIGNQAFTTKSLLKDLTIPITAVNISGEAFLGCNVARLHLKWPEPLEVRIVPKTDETILFVPQGTTDLYRHTRNWSRFKNIVEE